MGYKKGLVYFIDVLGTKGRDFDTNLSITQVFRKEMNNVQKRHRNTSVVDRCVFSFSDCAYIVYALKDEYQNNTDIKLKAIYQSLYNTTQTIATFLSKGFLCRGGIAYGDVYFDLSENIVFGPAVNCAYNLESKLAIYPNIIIEENLAKEILEFDRKIKSVNIMAKIQNGQIFLYNNETNQYYLNYLNYLCGVSCAGLGDKSYSFEQLYEEAIKMSTKEIDNNSNNKRVVDKYLWQINYLNSMKSIREAEVEVDPIEIFTMMSKLT
ncbi:hypothetical protein H0R90_03090 [Treponema putidum]|uniref:hypothetical protein n=1 Tax=Treponema putidum TaxID=221027 RepID=UPI0004F76450|nr:hypothetical protein [Treponema putidum]AIN94431.1 hypothetical protein JO40_10270 [Treponema putidum]TWI78983.1 hypothetical protein JM98_00570 [Treponema putidum]